MFNANNTIVLVNVATGKLYHKAPYSPAYYSTEGRAKAQVTRLINKGKAKEGQYAVKTLAQFHEEDPEIEVINLMSGKPFMQKRSVAGSACCPSSETYWCM